MAKFILINLLVYLVVTSTYCRLQSQVYSKRISRREFSYRQLMEKSKNNVANKTIEQYLATTINPNDFGIDAFSQSTRTDLEDFACLEACYNCVEDFPRKKKSPKKCGPTCDCANSCSRKSIEQINQLYGRRHPINGDKECFWRVYTEILGHSIPSIE